MSMTDASPAGGRTLAHVLALAGILTISFSAIFVRLAHVSPATAAFFRAAYAAPVLVVLWYVGRRSDARSPRARLKATLAGVILAVDLTLWHLAIGDIGAGLATVVTNVQVIVVGLSAWALYRERPTRLAALLVPVVLAGVTLISGLGRPGAYGAQPARGVMVGMLAGVAYAAFLLVLRAANSPATPPAGPLSDANFGTVAGAIVIGPLLDPGFSLVPGWPAHGWLLALAIGPQVAGWLFITAALPRLPALETSVLLLGQPMLTVFWAFLIFDERLSMLQWTGAALVLGGVGLLSVAGSVRKPVVRPERPF
jgi:drug/metabolite transporter (DMT)-like permease